MTQKVVTSTLGACRTEKVECNGQLSFQDVYLVNSAVFNFLAEIVTPKLIICCYFIRDRRVAVRGRYLPDAGLCRQLPSSVICHHFISLCTLYLPMPPPDHDIHLILVYLYHEWIPFIPIVILPTFIRSSMSSTENEICVCHCHNNAFHELSHLTYSWGKSGYANE